MATVETARERHTVHGVCPHDCPDTCGMSITVEDGRAVRIVGELFA